MGILKFIGRTLVSVIMAFIHLAIFIAKMEWHFVQKYIRMVNDYTGDGTLGIDGGAKETHWAVRYPIRAILWLFVPLVVLLVPVGFVATVIAIFVAIDQATYPSFPVSNEFVTISDKNAEPTVAKVGSALLTATYHQMEVEMDSTSGWTPNDTLGLQAFDNRVNRQLGVRHASIELLSVLVPNITKFGSVDAEDPRLTAARQGGFSNDPLSSDFTSFPFIETRYREGIDNIKSYQADVLAGKAGVHVNITNANIATIHRA